MPRALSSDGRLAGVQAALAALRGLTDLQTLLDRAAEALCRRCDFDRALLFRVVESSLVATSIYFHGDPEGAAAFLALAQDLRPRLDHTLPEAEAVRRRQPLLIGDALAHPHTFKPLVLAGDVRSYIAAPIVIEERVVGLVHADRQLTGRAVGPQDRDALWAFAEGFGYAVETAVLKERLRAGADRLRALSAAGGALATRFEREGDGAQVALGKPRRRPVAEPRLDMLLTRREREVLALMAAGQTNTAIAERLVIAESTVKSHVKHILRKLRAANRADAVSRYLRLAAAHVQDVADEGGLAMRGLNGEEPAPSV
jgi:DNA-binding CsgD family transcriptional regulator